MDWIISHAAVLSAFAVAMLDFIFALNKGLESNGILHMIYVWLKGSK